MNGRVISLCSGAGGMDLGFHRAGMRTVALCEIDPWRRRLLAARFPGVPCWPDLTTLDPSELPDADVLIGGTPCTDLSIVGRRGGLDGEHSGLFWDFCAVRNALGVKWTVWENVAGTLSSHGGVDFACVLGAFVGADVLVPGDGWPGAGVVAGPWGGACWRVLDAQHFGVPQRRHRVFVVGCLGGPCPPEVLFESEGGEGNSAARRGTRPRVAGAFGNGVAATLRGSVGTGGGGQKDQDLVVGVVSAKWRKGTGGPAGDECQNLVAHTLIAGDVQPSTPDRTGNTVGTTDEEAAQGDATGVDGSSSDADGMRASDGMAGRLDGAVSFAENQRGELLEKPIMDSLKVGGGKPGQGYPVVIGAGTERSACAFDPQPDGRRYAVCGDGVVASVAEWIARRIITYDPPTSL